MTSKDDLVPCCPARLVLDRIGDKWSVLIVLTLGEGPKRFSELRETLHHVTPKVLTHTLRGRERDGLLTRTVFAEVLSLRKAHDAHSAATTVS
ncbi:helix-turn-helix domain-containing protein [Streptomyces sp. NPDC002838]|uniref:winged helix-turn-helix transcriptional regulator n=1 Tax=Streptomyces sp. NPDC002838 TaxID=3154436 RepID=UPI0033316B8E